jgi:CO/xanthine dehydrogenase Mo-binding subunit
MNAVGARLPRYDGLKHVTAQTQYVDDVRVPGMLWAKGLRSPHDSARIVRIDTSRAVKLPGVHAVVTHVDMPTNIVGHLAALGVPADEPYFAVDEVRYRGQLIAGVAAEDEATALAAVDLIEVEYEEREPFIDVRRAYDAGQAQMTPDGNVFFYDPYYRRQVRKGDMAQAYEQADVIVQGSYRPAAIEQAPTETQVSLVVPQPDGRLHVYSCTQAMYFSMGVLATHLNMQLGRLKFYGGTVGGGFGGKVDTASEPLAALLALKARRPVKWRWTREEEMVCSSVRASWHMEVADALTKDGWLLGRQVVTLHDAGAYTRFSSYGATKHSFHLAGAYTVPHMHTDAYVVWTNRVPSTAMRGFGVTSVSFAVEMQMNRAAHVLGIDPWEFRLRNASRIGDVVPCRVVLEDPSAVQTIQAVAEAAGKELSAEYRTMTNAPREGDLMPAHLADQMATAKLADAKYRKGA